VEKTEALPGIFLLKEKALWIPEISAIVIADVHLGYESGMFDEPFYPKMQFREISERMERLMEKYGPEQVIINGDLKHEFSKTPYPEFSEVRDFLDILEDAKVTLVRGNHDNFIVGYLRNRGVQVVNFLETERFFFMHGHEEHNTKKIAIVGHEHPAIRIRDEIGGSAIFPCFLVKEDRIVMPAFSEMGGGYERIGRYEGYVIYLISQESITKIDNIRFI